VIYHNFVAVDNFVVSFQRTGNTEIGIYYHKFYGGWTLQFLRQEKLTSIEVVTGYA
jgi:hypothetical protein